MGKEFALHGFSGWLLWREKRPDGKAPWAIVVHDGHLVAHNGIIKDRASLQISYSILVMKIVIQNTLLCTRLAMW